MIIMTIQRMMMMMTKSLALSVVITLQECGLSWAQGVNCRTYSVYWTCELDAIGKYHRILMYTCIINTDILFEVFGQEQAHATVKIHKTCHIHKRSNICHFIFVQEFPELNELLCSLWTKNCYWNQKLPKQCRREVSWIPTFVSGIFQVSTVPVSSVQCPAVSVQHMGKRERLAGLNNKLNFQESSFQNFVFILQEQYQGRDWLSSLPTTQSAKCSSIHSLETKGFSICKKNCKAEQLDISIEYYWC